MKKRGLYALILALAMLLSLSSCGTGDTAPVKESSEENATASVPEEEASTEASPVESEKNGDIMILYTSDVHCGVEQGFGYAGLQQIRDSLESEGYTTLLVDDGDSVQGEPIGTMTQGESVIDLMNELHYDVAIPGNHEFDYGMDQFFALTERAQFPYVSCNFNKEGTLLFEPYVIKEAAGKKIAFVGVTTPQTLTSSTPSYFQDESGAYIYGFLQDKTGEKLYSAVQSAVDAARSEGVDYVYVLGHLGNEETARPWTYADVLEHTSGIDVLLDGHSHDTDQVTVKNKDGIDVVRSACGTKLGNVGYSHISAEDGSIDTGLYSWPNKDSVPSLLGVDNEVGAQVREELKKLDEKLNEVVATSAMELTIYDPVEVDSAGSPVRMVRRAETNLGDLCADACRQQSDADIAFENAGGIRESISKGDITKGDLLRVHPFGNSLCVIEVTGQQVLDALEWGARSIPDECGGFLQVSGLSYVIDPNVPSPCIEDENSMFVGIGDGERRVSDVKVNGEDIDTEKTYTLAGNDYMLLSHGDGFTMFDGCTLIQDRFKLDNQVLIDYLTEELHGVNSEEYADPYGQGRITVKR